MKVGNHLKSKKKFLALLIILISFVLLLFITTNVWNIKVDWSKIIEFFLIPTADIGSLATIIFGITGGVLALIGLVAIFISINSQHKVQKCRELYWKIINLSFKKEDPFDLSEEMMGLLWEYSKMSAYDDEEFVNNIIKGAQKTILYVLIVWTLFTLFAVFSFLIPGAIIIGIGYIGGILVLIFFHNILGRLKNLVDIGNLKETDKILDLAENQDFQGLFLLVNNIHLERGITGRNDSIIWPILKSPIQGFKVTLTGIQYITWKSAHETLEKQIKLKSESLIEKNKTHRTIRIDQYGDTDILDIELDIEDHSDAIKNWIHNGMFWSLKSESFLNIHRINDRLGFTKDDGEPRYEIITTKDKSGTEYKTVRAVVPDNTYAIRLSTYITLKKSGGSDQYLEIIWEIPMDLSVDPRVVAVRIGGNGRVLANNYWDVNQIEEDIKNIEKKEKEKEARWS